jgi:hypothetical protein
MENFVITQFISPLLISGEFVNFDSMKCFCPRIARIITNKAVRNKNSGLFLNSEIKENGK